jgi:type II secretion system protein N
LPRWLRILGLPLAGLLIFTFFVIRGFPYELLTERIAEQVGTLLDAQVSIAELSPRLQLAGPALEAGGVQVVWRDGGVLRLDRALLRPAWSLSWLKLQPAVYTEMEGPLGGIEGTLISGDGGVGGWDGQVRELDLSQLPAGALSGLTLSGWADAEIDVVLGDAGPDGTATFFAREGSILLPDVPMPLPFDVCKGELVFGGDAFLSVEAFTLEGPLLSADVSGSVASAPAFANAAIALDIEVSTEPAIRAVLQSAGIRVGRDGNASLKVTGTPSAPVVR